MASSIRVHKHIVAGELSEGELQRLAIARLLHQRPQLVILDEPFNSVSSNLGRALFKALEAAGITILMTGQLDSSFAKLLHSRYILSGTGDGSWHKQ